MSSTCAINPDMSFDDAAKTAIDSGRLSESEVVTLQSSLTEMRVLADKTPYTNSDEKKMSELRNTFDDLAVKGMPELEHLRPKKESWFSKVYPAAIGLGIVAVFIYFRDFNA